MSAVAARAARVTIAAVAALLPAVSLPATRADADTIWPLTNRQAKMGVIQGPGGKPVLGTGPAGSHLHWKGRVGTGPNAVQLGYYPSGHRSRDELCLGISGSSQAQRAAAAWGACTGDTSQKWEVIVSGRADESFSWAQLKNLHSGRCLEVSGAATAPGTPLIQWDCKSPWLGQSIASQSWKIPV